MGRSPRWTVGVDEVDLGDPRCFGGGWQADVWREARRVHPVAWTESLHAGGFWSVTSHRLGRQVLTQPRTFISGHGMRLGAREAGVRTASGRMLVVSDGQQHQALRSVHSAWFSADVVSSLQPLIDYMIDELVCDALSCGGVIDAVTELAFKIPTGVLFQIMSVPEEGRGELARLTTAAFDDAEQTASAAAARTQAHAQIFGYFVELADERERCPGQDIVTALLQGTVNGRPLSPDEVILNCDGLLNGGLETTPQAISGAILAFAKHEEVLQRIKENPDLLDVAVEEILRWTSPPMHAMRTAVADTRVGAASIRAGDRVVVWLTSCNWDEEVFAHADQFIVDRRPNPHLSFGAGPHYCVGAALARAELRSFVAAMIRRVSSVQVVGPVVRQRSNFMNGLTRLDVKLTAEP